MANDVYEFGSFPAALGEWYQSQVNRAGKTLDTHMDWARIAGPSDRNAVAHALQSALDTYRYGTAVAAAKQSGKEALEVPFSGHGFNYPDFKADVYNDRYGFGVGRAGRAQGLTEQQVIDQVLAGYRAGYLRSVQNPPSLLEAFFGAPRMQGVPTLAEECFTRGTKILMADGSSTSIEDIGTGGWVLSYDGFGDLIPARVTQLYRNVTTEWLVLANGLTVTPGHYVLNEHGAFERIDALVARDGKLVRADGSLESVTAERVVYTDATRHLYEEAEEAVYASEGGAAQSPGVRRGWRTYNFEVEGLHTYVAGGVRVHNRSDNLDAYATLINHDRSRALGYRGMASEYGRDVARATARGMDPHLALALSDRGSLRRAPPPAPTPLQRLLGLPADDAAPTPLQQVLGLSGDVRAPAPGLPPLRQVLGLDAEAAPTADDMDAAIAPEKPDPNPYGVRDLWERRMRVRGKRTLHERWPRPAYDTRSNDHAPHAAPMRRRRPNTAP